jgi:EAL domain-containing protein (putative c-di-GMP-specific phosphodiesterase class I)
VLWWLYDNFPFKYIKLDNSFVDTIDELQQDIYEYFDEEAERE